MAEMRVEQCKTLIVSDDTEFVNSLMQSWRRLHYEPEFTVSSLANQGLNQIPSAPPDSAVVVVDGPAGLACLTGQALLVIVIMAGQPWPEVASSQLRLVQIRRSEGWADLAAALAQEAILRIKAVQQVVEAERRMGEAEHFAAIGRFIVDQRHGLANALTSVLGNSELVLMDSGAELRDEIRGQLETIHAMSLRMHETLQRLSSLDTEMRKNRGASC
jgi:signal transduction histidine kinase